MEKKNDEIICYCNNVRVNDILKIISNKPDISFEDFQKLSNAGMSCTACILNLEDEFVSHTSNFTIQKKFFFKKNILNLSVKQLIYKFIDTLSPAIPIVIKNYFPIIYCKSLDIYIWVSNFSNLYKNNEGLVQHKIYVNFYNSLGKLIWKKFYLLEKNKEIRIKIPTDLLKTDSGMEVEHGWVSLTKAAKKSGYRGTTRPQIQFVSENASCAVHGQDIKPINGGSHSFVYNPDAERQFLSFFNIGKNKLELEINVLKKDGSVLKLDNISLNSLNSKLFEIKLDNLTINKFDSVLINWLGTGEYKCHVIIADKELKRFSIDHQ